MRCLRSIGVKRVEVIRGEKFIAINNDAVAECRTWPENSVDLIVTSVPFGNAVRIFRALSRTSAIQR
jgi:DNA modification methylase